MITLITGGVKSGKSTLALNLARARWKEWQFLATAEAFDEEMRERIAVHKAERGSEIPTIEEPLEIGRGAAPRTLLDCLTMWINNCIYYGKTDWEEYLKGYFDKAGGEGIIVTNETGLGTIPADPEVRRYHRFLGAANMAAALRADQVVMMVSGIPWVIKGPELEPSL